MKTIKIKDYYGNYQCIPVSDEMFEEWKKLQTESQRVFHLEKRHRSRVNFEDIDNLRPLDHSNALEGEYIRNEADAELFEAIKELTPTQKRRILMLIDGITLWQLTEYEHCDYNSLKSSVHGAMKRLKKILGDRCSF